MESYPYEKAKQVRFSILGQIHEIPHQVRNDSFDWCFLMSHQVWYESF